MAGRTGSAKKENDLFLLFGKIIKSARSTLEFIGRSVLYVFLYSVASILYFFYIIGAVTIRLIKLIFLINQVIGYATLFIIKTIFRIRPPKIRIRLPRVTLPRLRITFPRLRIRLPRVRNRALIAFSFLCLIILSIYFFYNSIIKDLPKPNKLITRDQVVTTKIYDRNGELLYKIYRNQNRTLVGLEEIPLALQQATIAIEDNDFYSHPGFTLKGITRAAFNTIFRRKLQGGSTITQQLVKTTLLTPERTLTRKVKELILAIQVEAYFSKDEILQMYLNEVGYGGATYGAEEATQVYFGKSVKELNLAEAALLAGLPQAPTQFSPFGAYPHLAKKRQAEVLRRIVEEKYTTQEQADQARRQTLVFVPQRTDIKAPHFVMYIKELLVKKYGEKMVEEGGLEVFTSLDLNIQKMAEKIVSEEIEKLRKLTVTNGAALVTNPQTGEILAMVGSKDYFNLEEDGNVNVTIMPRQPGSSIKVVNYAYALANGYTPATILSDTPITYKIPGQPPYSPRNYDSQFHGNIPLRVAFASSYNVPAVKVLASYGVEKMIDQGEKMGITTWKNRSRFGLSLTLGGGEVKMTDMAVVYGVLANLGRRIDLKPILQVKDYKGKILVSDATSPNSYDQPEKGAQAKMIGQRALSPEVAYLLTDILADNQARAPAFGPTSLLNIPNHTVTAKTGTTQNLRDNWIIGFTPSYLVAAWVGNNDNHPMSWVVSGITGATPIWHKIMNQLLKNKENQPFSRPQDLIEMEICSTNGLLPCEGCPTRKEYFIPGTEPKMHCLPESRSAESPRDKELEDKILEGLSTER